jgi:hypothetical protein
VQHCQFLRQCEGAATYATQRARIALRGEATSPVKEELVQHSSLTGYTEVREGPCGYLFRRHAQIVAGGGSWFTWHECEFTAIFCNPTISLRIYSL